MRYLTRGRLSAVTVIALLLGVLVATLVALPAEPGFPMTYGGSPMMSHPPSFYFDAPPWQWAQGAKVGFVTFVLAKGGGILILALARRSR